MVTTIPTQLQNPLFRFVLLGREKKPLEKDWTTSNARKFDDEVLIKHLESGGNYGVVGGYGNLCILDFDNAKVYDLIKDKLPKTFTVLSGGKRLPHLYYICKEKQEKSKVLDKDGATLVDIQFEGAQCVGPNSVHESGKIYKISEDIQIVEDIDINEVKATILSILPADMISDKNFVSEKFDFHIGDNIIKQIKDKFTVPQLLKEMGVDITINPTKCPFHSSVGGRNLSFKDDLWFCFHENEGGDVITLYRRANKFSFTAAKMSLADRFGISTIEEAPLIENIDDLKKGVLFDMAMHKMSDATEKMVKHILNKMNIYTIRDDATDEMWIYKDGIYLPQGESYVTEEVRIILDKAYKQSICTEVVKKIQADTYIAQEQFFEQPCSDIIAVKNGILNIKTRELFAFDPHLHFFTKISAGYDSNSVCPRFINFLKEITDNNVETMTVIQEMFGYSLYRTYFIPKAIMLLGKGRNGKSTLLEILKRFVGVENCSAITLQDLAKSDGFMQAELFNKLLNISNDLSEDDMKSTGVFKQLTGGDIIYANRKFKSGVKFVNFAKLIFATNKPPYVNDGGLAYFSRWQMLDFPLRFYSEQEIARMKEIGENTDDCKVANRELINEILPSELSGILSWSLDGLDRLFKNKMFSYCKAAAEIESEYMMSVDSFSYYANLYIESADFDDYIMKHELRDEYANFCKNHRLIVKSDTKIYNTMTKRYRAQTRQLKNENNQMAWMGVRFKDPAKHHSTGQQPLLGGD